MRLIDADALINRIIFHTDWSTDDKEAFEDEINEEPTIESEYKKGKWILHSYMPHKNYCSNCGKDSPYNRRWDFCPNCGKYMRGERNE